MPQKYKVFLNLQEGLHQALLYHISLFLKSSGLFLFKRFKNI